MNKTNIIISILIIILLGFIINYFRGNMINKNELMSKKVSANTADNFSIENESCKKVKSLFDSVPNIISYKEYTLDTVGCADTGVIVKYVNPTNNNYYIRTILNKETSHIKFIQNVGTAGHDVDEVMATIGGEMNNLKRFENKTISIKNNSAYNDVSYITTYKNEYVLTINIRAPDLSDKEKVEDYLGNYLESFDLSKLQ
jgi:hypothetical protein